MIRSRRCLFLFVVFAVLCGLGFLPLVLAGEAEASSAIASARQQLVVCFRAVVDAEAQGANVTGLADVLNGAGLLLSDAEVAFLNGDFDGARGLAVECQSRLASVVSDANRLGEAAVQAGTFDFWVFFVGSAVGAFVVIGVGVAVWFLVKKRYASRARMS